MQPSLLVYDSEKKENRIVKELSLLWQRRYLISQLIQRNLNTRYRRSILGIFWSILEPLATTIIMVGVFTYILKNRVEHFPIYLLSGLVIWNFFNASTNMAITELSMGNQLSKNVFIPKSVFVISGVASNFVNLLITIIILGILLIFYNIVLPWYSIFVILFALLLTTLFTLGVSFLVASANVFFSDVMRLYQIALRLIIYLSAVFYQVETFSGVIEWVIKLNPVYQLIYIFRCGVLFGTLPALTSVLYTLAWVAGMLGFGFYVYTRLSDRFIYYA
jgi:ABC-type polysaccharide/polyol phosphate export permease